MSQSDPLTAASEVQQRTDTIPRATKKIIFADQLRALAFLSVVIVHWLGIYSFNPDFISMVTGAPSAKIGNGVIYNLIAPPLPNFNFGPFGVAIFFMISGFVIPFSMKNKSSPGYILSRFIRIYPTYIVCALIMFLGYSLSHYYWGSQGNITTLQFLSNISLTASIFSYPSIDFVNWTLSIEVKFYIICFFLYRFIRNGNALPPLLLAALIFAVIFLTQGEPTPHLQGEFSFDGIKMEGVYLCFMFLGLFFNFLYENKITIVTFLIGNIILALCFFFSWKYGMHDNYFPSVICNYLYGYVVFAVAYVLRKFFRPFGPLKFLSNISYSFYALHSVIGYCIIRFLEYKGVNYLLAILIAFFVVMILSTLVYLTIERKCISIGKMLK